MFHTKYDDIKKRNKVILDATVTDFLLNSKYFFFLHQYTLHKIQCRMMN